MAKNIHTEEVVVIKIVDKRKAIGSQRKKAVLDELNVLKVKHPAVIELKDFFVTKDYLVLVME
jgi:serine/threonine protein kinase